ncbi:MAG TPA: IS110 family transposase [Anaerolineales bacterium]|nr:IS110 family transposase [Anaerolineales bacterium]
MSKNRSTHLRGERGQAFADLIRGVPSEQLLCVSLDISKYFHVAMIHNGLGEIVTPTFEVDIYQSGFDQLCRAIEHAKTRTQAQVVLVGMEPTSHYFENLARHLLMCQQSVKLINSFAVKQNREQQLMRREKTDQIDVAAIGDLLRRGEGTPYKPPTGIYLQLQQLDRVRLGKVKIERMLKNQIIGHLDRIFPGLVLLDAAAKQRYPPLFTTDFWQCQTLQDLIRVCLNPHDLVRMSPQQLVQAFHAQQRRLGPATAAKIIAQAHKTLLPDPEWAAIRCELLQHDLALLETVQNHLTTLEQRLVALVAQTPYQVWTKLKGLSAVQVASLAAAIGDPANYTDAAQIFRRSGLVSGRNDSGNRQRKGQGNHVIKAGDVYLRRALMSAMATLILHQPVLRRYDQKLQTTKPAPVARVATARKTNGILWAVLRDQSSNTLICCKGAEM